MPSDIILLSSVLRYYFQEEGIRWKRKQHIIWAENLISEFLPQKRLLQQKTRNLLLKISLHRRIFQRKIIRNPGKR